MIWKDVKEYEGLYQISDEGQVKSLGNNKSRKEKILKPTKNRDGYLQVPLCKNGKRKTIKIHRLVAEAFISNPDNLPEVNHKDENKINNCVENLEWCDRKYNINYGTGKKRGAEKLSKPVKQFDLQGNFIQEFSSIMEVERKYGYSQGNISSACSGRLRQVYNYRWSYA